MKKLFALLLALMMIFILAACDNGDNPGNTDNPGTSQGGENTPGGNTDNPGNNDNPGNQTGQIVTGGEVGKPAPAHNLPQNFKVFIDDTQYAQDITITKIGNDYMFINARGSDILVSCYKSVGSAWVLYQKNTTDGTLNGEWFEYGERTEEDLQTALVDHMLLSHLRYFSLDEFSSTGESQVISGVTVKAYEVDFGGIMEKYWFSDAGVVFKDSFNSSFVSSWDTTVTAFECALP